MADLFHFGPDARALFGIRHPPAAPARDAMLVCAPLLQEGIRCQRALWSLSEALAAAGVDVFRFDWYGSGDSAGETDAITVPGLVDDVRVATSTLRAATPARRIRSLGLRSAALPLLAWASASRNPTDMVLWAPQLDGQALVAGWRAQHRQQLREVGRFLGRDTSSGEDELLGFVLEPRLCPALEALQGSSLPLAAGSTILLAQWPDAPATEAFVQAQRAAGVTVDILQLDGIDIPAWDDPAHFDTQLFPRRAVSRLASHLAAMA